jgi:hypothetical protein
LFRTRIEPVVITPPGHHAPAPDGALTADSRRVHTLYGTPGGDALCLIRPDGYISRRCRLSEQDALLASFSSDLGLI